MRAEPPDVTELVVREPDGVEAGADAIAAIPVNCSVTVLLSGSIFDTGVPGIVTHTPPSPAAIHPPSPGTFAGIVAVTWLVCGSIRETLPSDWFRTQTAPSPVARKRGSA